jgi:integrase/recombinase XerD
MSSTINLNGKPDYIIALAKDLRLRNRSEKTVKGYVYSMLRMVKALKKHPNRCSLKEITDYLCEMISEGKYSFNTYKQNVCAIRYYYNHILGRKKEIANIPYPKREITNSVILSKDEVFRLLAAIKCPNVRLMACIAYACGLRHSEIRNLKHNDIDRSRMRLLIHLGKGKKSREVQMPHSILTRLEDHYRKYSSKMGVFFFR